MINCLCNKGATFLEFFERSHAIFMPLSVCTTLFRAICTQFMPLYLPHGALDHAIFFTKRQEISKIQLYLAGLLSVRHYTFLMDRCH